MGGGGKQKNLEKNTTSSLFLASLFVFHVVLNLFSPPQLCLAARVNWSLTWMAGETTQSSPWLELISDVQLKNAMRAHKRSEPSPCLLIFPSRASFPRYPFYQKQNGPRCQRSHCRGDRLWPSVAAEPGKAEALRCRAGEQTCEKWRTLDNNKCGL